MHTKKDMASKKLIVANWKMNPASAREAGRIARASDARGVVVCPPFPFLSAVGALLRRASLGAQDAFWEPQGAFTGAVSALELKRLGVRYVIVGHSERRRVFGETDAIVAKKVAAVAHAGSIPILCVGETKQEHVAGKTKRVVQRQLRVGLSLYHKPYTPNPIVIAYEPVWAIGTGVADKPAESARIAAFIRSQIRAPRVRVLYGGSVNAENVRAFLECSEIGGALVGGASLKVEEFKAIVRIAQRV